jgi:subtilase family serine protease
VSVPRLARARLGFAAACTALLTLGGAGVAAAAQPSPSPSWQQVPSGPTGGQLPGATAFGDTPGETPERVTFVLKGRGIAQLQQAVIAGTVGGPQRQLSVGQFAASYGQTPQQIAALTSYLARFGIRSTVLANRLDIATTGTAAAYNRALNVKQRQYRIPARPGHHGRKPSREQNVHAPTAAPQLPPQLAQGVTAIFGLSNYAAFGSSSTAGAVPGKTEGPIAPASVAAAVAKAGPASTISEDDCFAITLWPRDCNLPKDFASQYGLTALGAQNDGTGQTVGIVTFAALDAGTAEDFWKNLSLTPQRPRTVTVRNVDGGPGAPDENSDETDLDVEQAGGVAPGANVVVYQAPNTDAGGVDALFQAAVENVAGSVSMSWASSETFVAYAQATGTSSAGWQAAYDLAFLELAAQGQSTFVASGDAGPYQAYLEDELKTTNPTVSAFAASPYVTAAGGTTLPFTTDYWGAWTDEQLTVPSERAWSSDYLWGPTARTNEMSYADAAKFFLTGGIGSGGGGYSQSEPLPAYQRQVPGGSTFTAVQQLTPTAPQKIAPGLTLPTDWAVTEHPATVRGRATGRAVPDLSADADPFTGYLVSAPEYGGLVPLGGTSIVAPQLAGAAAVINQANRGRGGFWNPTLYRAAATRNSPLTPLSAAGVGNDNLYYTGTPGTVYNPATGLGTPDLGKLAAVLRRR